jgi:hypothetical protein
MIRIEGKAWQNCGSGGQHDADDVTNIHFIYMKYNA